MWTTAVFLVAVVFASSRDAENEVVSASASAEEILGSARAPQPTEGVLIIEASLPHSPIRLPKSPIFTTTSVDSASSLHDESRSVGDVVAPEPVLSIPESSTATAESVAPSIPPIAIDAPDSLVDELNILLAEKAYTPLDASVPKLASLSDGSRHTDQHATTSPPCDLAPWQEFTHVDPPEIAPAADEAIVALASMELLSILQRHSCSPIRIGKHFRTVKKLGAGAFGLVMRCKVSGRDDVALKMTASDTSACEEIEVLKTITAAKLRFPSHKGANRIVDFLGGFPLSPTIYCMAFEPLGPSLRDVLNHNRLGFHLDDIQDIGYDLLQALDFLHSQKYVHTDIKPENIMLVRLPVAAQIPMRFVPLFSHPPPASTSFIRPVKNSAGVMIIVIDLGSAHAPSDITASTLPYRSPEATKKHKWSYPTDMWSAGCVLGELATAMYLVENMNDEDPLNASRIDEMLSYGLKRHVQPHCRELYQLLSECLLLESPELRDTPCRASRHAFFRLKGRLE